MLKYDSFGLTGIFGSSSLVYFSAEALGKAVLTGEVDTES